MQSKTQRQIKEIPVVLPANILSCAKVVRYQIVKCVYFQTFLQISWGIVWGIVYFKFYPRGFSFSIFGYRYFKLITIFTGKYKLLEPQKRPHNPEVVGSSPASATIKNSRFHQKTSVFLTFWWLQKLQTLRLGVYLGFTPVVDSVFLTFGPKMIFGAKQHFGEIVPESCIQNGKTPFSLYNSVEYSEYSRLFDSICD